MLASDRILALDIGASSVKIGEFQTTRSQGLQLVNFNYADLGLDPEHEENRTALITATIQNMLREKNIRPGKVVFCVPGQSVFTRFVKLPHVDESKVVQIIQYEAQQNVPFPIQEVIWDYQLLGTGEGGSLEVVIVAIKSDIIEDLNSGAESAGLTTDLVDVAPMSLYNAFRYNTGNLDGSTLVMDIGACTTNLLFVENNRVFTRSIPIAGNTITQSIAAELGISFHDAEKLKKEKGFVALGGAYEEPPDPQQAQISKIIRHVMTKLHADIARSINFYRTQQGGNAPTRILLSGGSSILPYSDRFFKEKFQTNVEYFNPFQNVTISPNISRYDLARCAHFFGEVIGLALRRTSECPIEVSLLPQSIRDRKQAQQKQPYLIGAGLSVLLVPICLLAFSHRAYILKQNQLVQATEKVEKLEQLKNDIAEKLDKFNQMQQRTDPLLNIVEQHSRWPLLLEDLNQRIVSNLWIVSISEAALPGATNLTEGAEATTPTAGRRGRRAAIAEEGATPDASAAATQTPPGIVALRISGAGNRGADDLKRVDEFKQRLSNSAFFDKNNVEIEVPPAMGKETVFTFTLRAKLAKPMTY